VRPSSRFRSRAAFHTEFPRFSNQPATRTSQSPPSGCGQLLCNHTRSGIPVRWQKKRTRVPARSKFAHRASSPKTSDSRKLPCTALLRCKSHSTLEPSIDALKSQMDALEKVNGFAGAAARSGASRVNVSQNRGTFWRRRRARPPLSSREHGTLLHRLGCNFVWACSCLGSVSHAL